MNVLITGATGMVGSLVLQKCLDNPRVSSVTSLLRRPSGEKHPKLNEVVIDDFLALDESASWLSEIDAVLYCLGVYTGAVDRETLRQITVDYPNILAEAILTTSPNARFCLLSGAGADRSEKSRAAFARDKGAAENLLSVKGLGGFHSFRPGYIFPVTPRAEPNFGYRLMRWLYPVMRIAGDNSSIRSTDLAAAIVQVGLEGFEQENLENKDIVQLVNEKDL